MSERKVLNQYIPVNFDPALIPKSLYKRPHQYKTRIMLPFNVQCSACNHFMYRARKFNAKKETSDQKYLGISIFRFYFRCENCANEISFLTDPQNFNYTLEKGATRMFEYAIEKQQALKKLREERESEEQGDVMKMLENRTEDSLRERRLVEALDDLEELRKQQEHLDILSTIEEKRKDQEKRLLEEEDELAQEDEEEIATLFGNGGYQARQAQLQSLVQSNSNNNIQKRESNGKVRDEYGYNSDVERDDDLEEYESEDENSMLFGAGERNEQDMENITTLRSNLINSQNQFIQQVKQAKQVTSDRYRNKDNAGGDVGNDRGDGTDNSGSNTGGGVRNTQDTLKRSYTIAEAGETNKSNGINDNKVSQSDDIVEKKLKTKVDALFTNVSMSIPSTSHTTDSTNTSTINPTSIATNTQINKKIVVVKKKVEEVIPSMPLFSGYSSDDDD